MTVSRRLLTHVGLGAAFVIAVVTVVIYALVYQALKQRDLRHLDTYIAERALREEARFQQVQSNLMLVRGEYLKRLETPMPPEYVARQFDHWYRRYDDGAWRSREQFGDAHKTSSMWADQEWEATPEQRRQVVLAQELCDEILPGWVDTFPSYYFQFPKPGLVNVGVDVLLADWSWKMPGHFDTTGLEWIAAALPGGVPPDSFTWTGLQMDSVISEPLVCIYLPMVKDGVFLGSVGHNMNMSRMLDEATRSNVTGVSHFILRRDGRLMAHPTKRAEILASKGLLTAQDCGDPALLSLYRLCAGQTARRFSGFDATNDAYYSVARLSGPEWFYITTISQARLQQQAFASAKLVLWSGLVSFALVLVFLAVILRTQVARPLAELTRATKAMSAGTAVPLPPARTDELGILAASFREMVAQVAAREGDLRELNADLERRVQERTEELHRALAHEKELGEMKGNFVSLVSHEFRTPLGVIMSAVEVLQRYFERLPADKRARHLEMIFRSTKNLANLIEEVLLLGRVEEGRMQFSPVPLDLEKLCRTLADELFSATGGACPIRFRALSPLDGAVSDEALLRHILCNLLSNAVKYSEPGTPVEFTAARHDTDIVFTIRDRGIGIPPEDQPKLFTSFTRGHNVGTRPGTGLGLVVVQRCVQLHRGTIALDSAPGSGTTAIVSLPVFFPTHHHHCHIIMKTILIIEDQPDMRENIATILEMEDHAVLTAENGREGIEMAREEKPDLILCDVMMPKMDGHEVLNALRADRTIAGTPFIFLTAKGEKRDHREGMNLGADDYLTKPVSAPELLGAINARFERELKRSAGFTPDFSSPAPLETLGLTPRESEVLLWVAQGKSNPEISTILGAAENTIKVHLAHIFEKLGADNRHAASLIALEKLGA